MGRGEEKRQLRREGERHTVPAGQRDPQRLGGLMSMTESMALASMSLPRRRRAASSSSGVKMLLPLLVLSDCSVGLKLTGERKLWPWLRRARGKVFRPGGGSGPEPESVCIYPTGRCERADSTCAAIFLKYDQIVTIFIYTRAF